MPARGPEMRRCGGVSHGVGRQCTRRGGCAADMAGPLHALEGLLLISEHGHARPGHQAALSLANPAADIVFKHSDQVELPAAQVVSTWTKLALMDGDALFLQRRLRRRQAEEHARQLAYKRRLAAAVTTEAPGQKPTSPGASEPQGRRLSRRVLSLTSGQAAAAAEAAVAAAYDMARTLAFLTCFPCSVCHQGEHHVHSVASSIRVT